LSPRETNFTREAVLEAALGLVREEGWQALTARALGKRLEASVAPLYSTYGSMEALEREILQAARQRLDALMAVSYTQDAFLNIGVGMVVFARDEAHLFSALFHAKHSHSDIVDAIFASILESMKADATLRLLSDASLERLLHNLGMYTLGLAASIVYGRGEDPSTDNIIRQLRNAGNMMIHGELSGLAEADSPESEREWRRIIAEKQLVLPDGPRAAGQAGLDTKKETP
jgi:AcrR family transcriptional regulator